ncbi:hypothetical protein FEZ30_01320 [Acidipropionibacterium acidipropionici]|nr:hypothetical protein FEZ30_01320 [Acidipropionibacterium acidipropionici]
MPKRTTVQMYQNNKYSGHPAVCMATSGPGVIHLLNGLVRASRAAGR